MVAMPRRGMLLLTTLAGYMLLSISAFKVEGCTDATMINYNRHATVDNGSCFPIVSGCLDRKAQNFNCTLPGEDDGTTAKQMVLGCNIFAKGGRGVTVHSDEACTERVPSPPSHENQGVQKLLQAESDEAAEVVRARAANVVRLEPPLLMTAQAGGRHPNQNSFAALKDGSTSRGGSGSGAPTDSGYTAIFATSQEFAALKADGSITVWGWSGASGSTGDAPTDAGYTTIYSTLYSFAALKADGSITAWGSSASGGSGAPTDGGYITIASTSHGFAALRRSDGSIATWFSGYSRRRVRSQRR